jgi:hypothetical protein
MLGLIHVSCLIFINRYFLRFDFVPIVRDFAHIFLLNLVISYNAMCQLPMFGWQKNEVHISSSIGEGTVMQVREKEHINEDEN